MIPMPLSEVARALNGELRPADAGGSATGVATDTRRIKSGDLFFALDGANFKGSDFLPEAIRGGACAAVTHTPRECGGPLVVVEDAGRALMILARSLRDNLDIPVFGITGSNGKTTTKDALFSVLASKYRCVAAEGSYNNRVGLPLTMARVEVDTEVLVLEIGTSAPGEIKRLSETGRPTVGVITSIGHSHLEGLGSIEGVLTEKLDLVRGMSEEATLFLNGDDENLARAAKELKGKPGLPQIKTYGVDAADDVDFRSYHAVADLDGVRFSLSENGPTLSAPLMGRHNLQNLLAVALCAQSLGMTEEEIAEGFTTIKSSPMRMEEREIGGKRVIFDCYNANPTSMTAAVSFFQGLDTSNRRVAILGDMLELGDASRSMHAEIGELCGRETHVELTLFVGNEMRYAYDACVKHNEMCGWVEDAEAAKAWANDTLTEGDFVLLKASRGMGLERLFKEDGA